MNSNRRLSDHARASIAGNLRLGVNWQRVRAEFSETEWRECEALVGLEQPSDEFRSAITDAVFLALCLHTAPPKRASIVRKEMELLARRAADAATALEQLRLALNQAIPWDRSIADPPEPMATLIAPATLDCLGGLAEAAGRGRDRVKVDKGGPTRMVAFHIFVRVLADAFQRATGHAASLSWSEDRNR